MSNKKKYDGFNTVREALDIDAVLGERTRVRSRQAPESATQDILDGGVYEAFTPKGQRTVQARWHSDNDVSRVRTFRDEHPGVAEPILKNIIGCLPVTEVVSSIESHFAEREAKACKAAHDEGYAEGYADGESEGYSEGYAEGTRDTIIKVGYGLGGLAVGALGCYGIYKAHEYFTSDEYKAKREAKLTKRMIKRLEKRGYTVVPPDESDESDELLEIDEDLRRLELEVLGY